MVAPFNPNQVTLLGEGKLIYVEETPSTMPLAAEYAQNGAPAWTTIVANNQTAGKGRQGKTWQHQAGCNLAATIILPPNLPQQLSFYVAVALHKTLQPLVNEPVELKWPNDIFIQNKKVSGVLIERRQGPAYDFTLLGVGINVRRTSQAFANSVSQPFITLEEVGNTASREQILSQFIANLATQLSESWDEIILPYYKKHCQTVGKTITWQNGTQAENSVTGLVTDLRADGALQLKAQDGTHLHILAGEIVETSQQHPLNAGAEDKTNDRNQIGSQKSCP